MARLEALYICLQTTTCWLGILSVEEEKFTLTAFFFTYRQLVFDNRPPVHFRSSATSIFAHTCVPRLGGARAQILDVKQGVCGFVCHMPHM